MVRKILATAMLLGCVSGGLLLVRSNPSPTSMDPPERFRPEFDPRELTPTGELTEQESPDQFLERIARESAATKRMAYEKPADDVGDCTGPECCGDDRIPSRAELIAMGWPLPADPLGRWMSPSTAETDEIPIPMIDPNGDSYFGILLLQSEEEALDENNEPTGPLSLKGPSLGPAADDAANEAPEPSVESEPEMNYADEIPVMGESPEGEIPAELDDEDMPLNTPAEPERLVLPNSTVPNETAKPSNKPSQTPPVAPQEVPDAPRTIPGTTESLQQSTVPPPPKKPVVTYPKQLEPLKQKIRGTLAHYYFRRQEDLARRSPWGVMHCLIAYGVDTQVTSQNRRVNAIGWLCYNGVCNTQNLFYIDKATDKVQARLGVGVQGHAGQFLAMMAQSKVKSDFPMLVEKQQLTLKDLIEYEQNTCRAGTELTFKLIAFSHYLPSDTTWKNDLNEDWSIPRLIREEMKQPIVGAACGGTHRLMGLSYAVNNRRKQGKPIDAEWARAEQFTESYRQYLFRLQNSDGSFSTDWFASKADNGKEDRKLQTTGHMLEWLIYSLPQEKLTDVRVQRAVMKVSNILMSEPYKDWSIGPRGHALHALALYDERVFGGRPGERAAELAASVKSAMPSQRR